MSALSPQEKQFILFYMRAGEQPIGTVYITNSGVVAYKESRRTWILWGSPWQESQIAQRMATEEIQGAVWHFH